MHNDTYARYSLDQADLDNGLSGTLLAVQLVSYSAVNKIHLSLLPARGKLHKE